MKNLLKNKYSNILELIEETGKIPVRCIDDGEFEQLTKEIEALGYRCRLDPSTDYLLAEKLTRSELINALKEVGSVRVNSKELEDIMPLTYEYFLDIFQRFVNNNKATEKDLEDFRSGKFLVAIYFGYKTITYTVGRDAQQLANEPDWAEDLWDDIELEELQALLKVAK